MSEELKVTVLVDGEPENKTYRADEKVEEVIKSLLPPKEKHDWQQWQLKRGTQLLDASKSLEANGVKSGDTLAFTKKEGGGGSFK